MRNTRIKLSILVFLVSIICGLYLTFNTYGDFSFAWQIRGEKLLAFVLVALATSIATISFQTLTQNHFLTPNILGLDSLYVLIQTCLFFFLGGIRVLSQNSEFFFFVSVFSMAALSLGLSQILERMNKDLFLLLMVGLVLGTLFSSLSSFFQVIMDPNEYVLLQGKLFASFGNVATTHLFLAGILIFSCTGLFFYYHTTLDVLHLGYDQATNLGISVKSFQRILLLGISLLTGTATALVGPITFLGFIIANISYQLMGTFQHRVLFSVSFLLGVIFLVGGQFLVEQVFHWQTTIGTVIQFVGGLYFVGRLLQERRKV